MKSLKEYILSVNESSQSFEKTINISVYAFDKWKKSNKDKYEILYSEADKIYMIYKHEKGFGENVKWSGEHIGTYNCTTGELFFDDKIFNINESQNDDDLLNESKTAKSWEKITDKGKVTDEVISNAVFGSSFMDDRAWANIDGNIYEKIGKNKWQATSSQEHTLSGTITDKEMFDVIQKCKEFKLNLSIL